MQQMFDQALQEIEGRLNEAKKGDAHPLRYLRGIERAARRGQDEFLKYYRDLSKEHNDG